MNQGRRHVTATAVLSALLGLLFATLLVAQTPTPTTPGGPPEQRTTQPQTVDPTRLPGLAELAGDCPPPSTQQQILIGVGTLVFGVVAFLLAVQLIQRRYIQLDRNATLGRHLGYSLTVVLTSAFGFLLAYFLTECWHPKYWYWLAFVVVLWLLHLLYTLLVVRRS